MENHRVIKICLSLVVISCAIPSLVFAYSPDTTHAALTQEIVKFFNASFPKQQINSSEAQSVIQGSIDEDKGLRFMHHFYDPVHRRGLTLETNAPKNLNLAFVAAGAQSQWQSSKDWATDTLSQAGIKQKLFGGVLADYFGGADDYSWDRAIYEYAWGSRTRGLEALGHVLHLLEDATVPDHTRNDPHPHVLNMGSPYEDWTKQFDRSNTNIADRIRGEQPILLSSIGSYFDAMAGYSNNNFFSKDTIFSTRYVKPIVFEERIQKLSDGKDYTFGYGVLSNGDKHRIVVSKRILGSANVIREITDPNNLILSDYWSRLSRYAVLNGAGVMKLFFDQVEREKQTKALYTKNRSWFGKTIDTFKSGAFGLATVLYGSSVTEKDLKDDTDSTAPQLSNQILIPPPPPPSPTPPAPTPALTPDVVVQVKPQVISDTPSSVQSVQKDSPIIILRQTPLPTPAHVPQTPAPAPPIKIALTKSPASGASSGGIGIVEGNTSPTQSLAATQSPSSTENTTATSSAISSTSSATSTATTTTPTPTPPPAPPPSPPADTTAPDISFAVPPCAASLSVTGCLIATTTMVMNWSSSASDLNRYALTCTTNGVACANFSYASTTATSTTFTGADNTTYVFSAAAIDHAGNMSTPMVQTIAIATRPIVINEIAWSGTSAPRNADEWIELYNVTDYDIALTKWVLYSTTDHTPYIQLGLASVPVIAGKGYFVLERTDDMTIPDIAANQMYAGSLVNSGEVLELLYASTTMDKTPAPCGSAWCYGSVGQNHLTMERYDPYSSGDDQFNWGSWAGFGASHKNVDNVAIQGTPGRRNSLNYLVGKGAATLTVNTTLTKSHSPYVIATTNLTIGGGVTMDVEAGTVVKFLGANSLTINGVIKTHGTATDPVVFTSINDDAYGGDVNGDGTTTPAQAGDWNTIQPTSSGLIFDHTIIRYGGKIDPFFGSIRANLQASNLALTITNSRSEFSQTNGLYVSNVSGEVSSSTFANNRALSGYAGMEVSAGGSIVITHNTFQKNSIGLSIGGSSSQTTVVSHNSFLDNDQYAIQFSGGRVSFSASSASNNGADGIMISGSSLGGITLNADLPYVFDSNTTKSVSSGAILTISPGAVLKFKSAATVYIDGALDSQGTATSPIVFTSFHDDDCGIMPVCGDTNNATTSPQAGDWGGLIFRSTGSATSTLAYAMVRYGGNKNVNIGDRGAVAIQNATAPVAISNSTIEKSFFAGIAAIGSGTASTTISNSIIRDNLSSFGSATAGYGVWSSASAHPTISTTRFSNNGQHIATSSASWIDGGGNVLE